MCFFSKRGVQYFTMIYFMNLELEGFIDNVDLDCSGDVYHIYLDNEVVSFEISDDLDEFEIILSFIESITDMEIKNDFLEVIDDRDAVRNFRSCLNKHNLDKTFLQYKKSVYVKFLDNLSL